MNAFKYLNSMLALQCAHIASEAIIERACDPRPLCPKGLEP